VSSPNHFASGIWHLASGIWHPETRFRTKSNKNWYWKVPGFGHLSMNQILSLLDVPKSITYNIAFICDYVMSGLVENLCAYSRRRTWQASSCIWTMHILIIRGSLVNISKDFVFVEFHIWLTVLTWLMYFFFEYLKTKLVGLVIWSKKELSSGT
jgi:hypothetical protein